MNTGLQDAYNLAWKLALVVKGRADAALLDTYEQERMPVAQRLLETTDRAFQLVVSESWLAGMFRTTDHRRGRGSRDDVRAGAPACVPHHLADRHQLSAQPAVADARQAARQAPHAGERFPWLHLKMQANGPAEDLFQTLDDTRFNLLVFGPAPAIALAGYGDLVREYAIPLDPGNRAALDRVGIAIPSFYLLRPDGHVGLCGTQVDLPAVEAYLTRWLHRAPVRTDRVRPGLDRDPAQLGELVDRRLAAEAAVARAP